MTKSFLCRPTILTLLKDFPPFCYEKKFNPYELHFFIAKNKKKIPFRNCCQWNHQYSCIFDSLCWKILHSHMLCHWADPMESCCMIENLQATENLFASKQFFQSVPIWLLVNENIESTLMEKFAIFPRVVILTMTSKIHSTVRQLAFTSILTWCWSI